MNFQNAQDFERYLESQNSGYDFIARIEDEIEKVDIYLEQLRMIRKKYRKRINNVSVVYINEICYYRKNDTSVYLYVDETMCGVPEFIWNGYQWIHLSEHYELKSLDEL